MPDESGDRDAAVAAANSYLDPAAIAALGAVVATLDLRTEVDALLL